MFGLRASGFCFGSRGLKLFRDLKDNADILGCQVILRGQGWPEALPVAGAAGKGTHGLGALGTN